MFGPVMSLFRFSILAPGKNCATSTASAPRCLTGFTRSYRSSTCFAVDLVLGGLFHEDILIG